MEQTGEVRKRNVAYKLTVGEILRGKPMYGDEKLMFVEINGKNVVRVNVLANCIDKFVSNSEEKKYASLTVDDASGQIRLKVFGDEVAGIEPVMQGDTLQIIGNVRIWNDEVYLTPEIIKKVDPRWLLVRKLEIQKQRTDNPPVVNDSGDAANGAAAAPQTAQANAVKDEVMQKIKDAEVDGGIDIDSLIMGSTSSPEVLNEEIKKLLEEGLIYEPRPGRLRYLG